MINKYLTLSALALFVAFVAISETHKNHSKNHEKSYQTAQSEPTVWDETKSVTNDVWDGTKEVASNIWDGTKEVSNDVWEGAKKVTGDVSDAVTSDEKTPENDQTSKTQN